MTNVEFHVATWRKSSHSGSEGQECVEVGALRASRMVGMRDSRDPDGPVLAFTTSEWAQFLTRVRSNGLSRGRR